MKQRFKAWFMKMCRTAPALMQRTISMLKGAAGTLAPCALVLALVYMLGTAAQSVKAAEGAAMLLELVNGIVITPVLAGMMTYAVGACWEKRNVNLVDAGHLARIRIKEMIITGLAAGVVGMAVNWIGTMMYSLIQLVSMLLGWIPVVGSVIAGIVGCALWLVSLAMEFVVHAALVMGMLALTADGVSGRAQIEQVLGVLRGGWSNLLTELGLIFGLWIIVHGISEVLGMVLPVGAAIAWNLAVGALTAVSLTAVSVIYLRMRDRRSGTNYYA